MSQVVLRYLNQSSFILNHKDSIDQIKDFYSRRLYYELSEFVIQFLVDILIEEHNYQEFYNIFVLDFARRINPTSLARITIIITTQIKKKDVDLALEFMSTNMERAPLSDNKFSLNLCKVYRAKLQLYKMQIIPAHDTLMHIRKEIETLNDITLLHLFFYDAILYYHYLKTDYLMYNSDVLKYFGARSKINVIIDDDQVNKPLFCIVSTVMSPYVTNMEEVLYQEPVQSFIENEEYRWLGQLLRAILHGDFSALNDIMPNIQSHAVFGENVTLVKEKVVLMNILNLAFNSIVNHTDMTFTLISESSGISMELVEQFLIRAFSLNIIKGSIDQVNQVVHLTWVKPKFITEARIPCLKEQIGMWNRTILDLVQSIKQDSVELNLIKQVTSCS